MDFETVEARNKEACKYYDWVKYKAGQLIVTLPQSVLIDDLIQDGMLGVMDALNRYDPTKGYPFKFFARDRVIGAMLDGLRKGGANPNSREVKRGKKKARTVFTNETQVAKERAGTECLTSPFELPDRRLASKNSNSGKELELIDIKDSLDVLKKRIPEEIYRFLELHFVKGVTLRAMSKKAGVGEARYSQVRKEILERCVKVLAGKKVKKWPSVVRRGNG